MNINKHREDYEMEMNMTPMIDIVFLLIVFFMIISDLTQQDLEELKLPVAMQAVEDKPDPKKVRPVINVLHDGTMIVKTVVKYTAEKDDTTELERFLSDQANLMPKKPLNENAPASSGNPLIPDNPLLIRADQNTEFKYIQRVMTLCGKKGIQIWKLELAAAEDPEKVKARKEGGE